MKAVLDTLDGVAEAIKAEYEPREGKFVLKVEGSVPGLVRATELQEANQRLTEFRDNNRSLNSLKTELEGKLRAFEGIDPVEHAKLKVQIKELEAKGVKGGPDVEQLVSNAVKAAVGPLETKLRTIETSEAEARAANARLRLEQNLKDAASKAGVNPSAITDAVTRGMGIFSVHDGTIVARKGDVPIFSKAKPAEVLTMDEYFVELQADAPHLYLPSKGAGAQGNGGLPGGGVHKKTISSDPMEFGRNLEGIAKGEVLVQQ